MVMLFIIILQNESNNAPSIKMDLLSIIFLFNVPCYHYLLVSDQSILMLIYRNNFFFIKCDIPGTCASFLPPPSSLPFRFTLSIASFLCCSCGVNNNGKSQYGELNTSVCFGLVLSFINFCLDVLPACMSVYHESAMSVEPRLGLDPLKLGFLSY